MKYTINPYKMKDILVEEYPWIDKFVSVLFEYGWEFYPAEVRIKHEFDLHDFMEKFDYELVKKDKDLQIYSPISDINMNGFFEHLVKGLFLFPDESFVEYDIDTNTFEFNILCEIPKIHFDNIPKHSIYLSEIDGDLVLKKINERYKLYIVKNIGNCGIKYLNPDDEFIQLFKKYNQ